MFPIFDLECHLSLVASSCHLSLHALHPHLTRAMGDGKTMGRWIKTCQNYGENDGLTQFHGSSWITMDHHDHHVPICNGHDWICAVHYSTKPDKLNHTQFR